MEGTGPPPGSRSRPAGTLVGLLAHPDRLRVFAAVALGASTVHEVAAAAGVGERAAVVALERLAAAGAVVQEAGALRVDRDVFERAARAAAAERLEAEATLDDFSGVPAASAAVLRNFVRSGRLIRIPAQRSKRLVVLDWLAARFEPGEVYSEARVNLVLGMVHADVAALRRYLVDEGFLERREGFYWRAGGTFEVG